MDRKVIIIDKNRIGLFDLCSMKIDDSSLDRTRLNYELDIRQDTVLESKTLKRKIEQLITRRRKYENK